MNDDMKPPQSSRYDAPQEPSTPQQPGPQQYQQPQGQPYQGAQYQPQGQQFGYGPQYPNYAWQGQPFPPQGIYYPPTMNRRWNTLCIVGFVMAFLIPPVGLVLSIIALTQINRSHEQSKGLTLAGIIIGAINTAIMALVIGLVAWAFSNMTYYGDEMCLGDTCSQYSDMDADKFASINRTAFQQLLNDTQK